MMQYQQDIYQKPKKKLNADLWGGKYTQGKGGEGTNGMGGPWDWFSNNVIKPIQNAIQPQSAPPPASTLNVNTIRQSLPNQNVPVNLNTSGNLPNVTTTARDNFTNTASNLTSQPQYNPAPQQDSAPAPSFNPRQAGYSPSSFSFTNYLKGFTDPNYASGTQAGVAGKTGSFLNNYFDTATRAAGIATANPFLANLGTFIPELNIGENLESYGGYANDLISRGLSAITPSAYASGDTTYSGDIGDNGYVLNSSNLAAASQTPGLIGSDGSTYDPRKLTTSQDLNNKLISNINNITQDTTNYGQQFQDNLSDDWLLVDQQNQNDINNLLNQNYASQEDFQNAIAEQQRQDALRQYDVLRQNWESQIPTMEADINNNITTQEQNLADIQKNAEATKASDTNTYQDIIRKLTKNANAAQVKTGNIFSGLGTVNSSAYQNAVGKIQNTLLEGTNDTEQKLAQRLQNITGTVEKAQRDTDNIINQIKTDGQAKIQAVRNAINVSEAEKASRIMEITANAQQAIQNALTTLNQQKTALAQQAYQNAQNVYQLGLQNNFNKDLLGTQYDLELRNQLASVQQDQDVVSAIKSLYTKRGGPVSPDDPEMQQILQAYGVTYEDIAPTLATTTYIR